MPRCHNLVCLMVVVAASLIPHCSGGNPYDQYDTYIPYDSFQDRGNLGAIPRMDELSYKPAVSYGNQGQAEQPVEQPKVYDYEELMARQQELRKNMNFDHPAYGGRGRQPEQPAQQPEPQPQYQQQQPQYAHNQPYQQAVDAFMPAVNNPNYNPQPNSGYQSGTYNNPHGQGGGGTGYQGVQPPPQVQYPGFGRGTGYHGVQPQPQAQYPGAGGGTGYQWGQSQPKVQYPSPVAPAQPKYVPEPIKPPKPYVRPEDAGLPSFQEELEEDDQFQEEPVASETDTHFMNPPSTIQRIKDWYTRFTTKSSSPPLFTRTVGRYSKYLFALGITRLL